MDWRSILKKNFRELNTLIEFLEIDKEKREDLLKNPSFPLNVPYRLALKMRKNDLQDPLFKQFVALTEEIEFNEICCLDPVGDKNAQKEKKLLHKYETRALLLTTSICPMNCRFCFRKHFPYETIRPGFQEELKKINEDTSLDEVILSGGDPLSLSDEALKRLLQELDQIPHLKRIRFHTRYPVGIPERITEELLNLFKNTRAQIIFTLHTNHPCELDKEVFEALKKIQYLGIPILTQTVLLKGVNDDLDTLKTLFTLLVNEGILPYYLHQLDQVQGALHFEVEPDFGKKLMEDLRKHLTGYALPRYVKEIKGEASKTPL